MSSTPLPLIFGLSGLALTLEERDFFKRVNPFGFILFRWNMETPTQIKALIADLKETVNRDDIPLLVDAEGGRVFRLPEAHYAKPPASQKFGDMYLADPQAARAACTENARGIGKALAELGFTVNCAPLLDLRVPGAHDIIGDRAFGADPEMVGDLGGCVITGLQKEGIAPVIKHIPGHGAALEDSHDALPIVTLSRQELEPHWRPFQMNNDAPWAMTAHIVYEAIDLLQPATFSRPVIQEVIRGEIGFKGLLISDDLYMKAVSGSPEEKVARTLAAGCDVALYARGGVSEFERAVMGVGEELRELKKI